jgi:hypothetical protein
MVCWQTGHSLSTSGMILNRFSETNLPTKQYSEVLRDQILIMAPKEKLAGSFYR